MPPLHPLPSKRNAVQELATRIGCNSYLRTVFETLPIPGTRASHAGGLQCPGAERPWQAQDLSPLTQCQNLAVFVHNAAQTAATAPDDPDAVTTWNIAVDFMRPVTKHRLLPRISALVAAYPSTEDRATWLQGAETRCADLFE